MTKAAPKKAPPKTDEVKCRVSKVGDNKISDGKGSNFSWKDIISLPLANATALEKRGFVEIEE